MEGDQYLLLNLLGKGTFTNVYEVKRTSDNHKFAAKFLDDEKLQLQYTLGKQEEIFIKECKNILCLLYTSPSPRDATLSRMPSSA